MFLESLDRFDIFLLLDTGVCLCGVYLVLRRQIHINVFPDMRILLSHSLYFLWSTWFTQRIMLFVSLFELSVCYLGRKCLAKRQQMYFDIVFVGYIVFTLRIERLFSIIMQYSRNFGILLTVPLFFYSYRLC